MAHKVTIADGNWNNASTWGSITNESQTINLFGTISITGTAVYSNVFTAPSISDACKGGVVFISSLTGTGNLTFTLQEFDGAVWNDTAATVTIDVENIINFLTINFFQTWFQFRFASDYTFTTTNAGYYRFKVERSSGTAIISLQYGSSSSEPFVYAVDDRTGVPASTDDVFILGYNTTTDITATVDGTRTIGSGASTTINFFLGQLQDAVVIGIGGILNWSTTVDASLTVTGAYRIAWGGTWQIGSSASPLPAAYTATLSFDNDPSATYGIAGSSGGKIILQGAPKSSTTLWNTTVASGVGTAASPLVTDDAVDWDVGDYIVFPPSSNNSGNYNETEYRYIITKNSATSYVLSNTSGGAEAALSNDHSLNPIFNVTRNIIITTPSSSRGYTISASFPDLSFIDIDWVEFNKPNSVVLASGSTQYVDIRYSVISSPLSTTGFQIGAVASSSVVEGLIGYNGTSATTQMFSFTNSENLNAQSCYAIDTNRSGFSVGGANASFNLHAYGCNQSGSNNYAAFDLSGNSVNTIFSDCEAQACRYSMRADQTFAGTWINPQFGNKGNNTSLHINVQNNVPLQLIMENLLLNTNITFINTQSSSGYIGQKVGVQTYGGAEGDNRFFTYFGKGVSTGAGLTDTTTRTSGSRSLRLEPNSFVGSMNFSFKAVARAGKAISVLGFGKKNATLQNSLVTISLFLPGSTTPDNTFTMPNDTNWNLWSVSAVYNGTEDRYARVDINVASPGTSSGYFYLDDIFNGTNVITALDLWDEGFPSPVMFEQLGDPQAVWAVANTGHALNTMGDLVDKTQQRVDDAGVMALLK